MTKVQTLLGLDYGLKRIGVAVGQTLTGTARPLCIIHNASSQPNWAKLDQIFQEWQPDALVVGLPLHADGSTSDSTTAVHTFSTTLQQRYTYPIYHIDERLSSIEAATRVQRQDKLDAVAAQVILETWLRENAY